MRLLGFRLSVAVTLTALLACSGLGVCWKQFARMTHHCCPGGGSDDSQVKPCASVVAHEAAVLMPPPVVATSGILRASSALADVPVDSGPHFAAKGPPLILRI
jgi:hypothetical protein